jgi:hypothetical protein
LESKFVDGIAPTNRLPALSKASPSGLLNPEAKGALLSIRSEFNDFVAIYSKHILRRRASADQTDYGETQDPAY